MATPIAPEIFKAYDIRGIVDKTLTEEAAELIGRGLGTLGAAKGVKRFVVGRDGRLSGPRLAAALTRGLNAAGMDVIDIGMVATPMVYFATYELGTGSGVMVTGSHNPPEYNGLKMMVAGDTLASRGDPGPAPAHRGRQVRHRQGHAPSRRTWPPPTSSASRAT